jgi:hypothetical protein
MRFVCLLLALALSSLSLCQQMSVSDVLKSATRPTKISVKDLPADYTAVKITSATGFDYMSSYMPFMFLAAGGAQANAGDMVSAVTSSWTSGEIINVEGTRFLVTYKMVANYSTMGISGSRQGMPSLPDELVLELVKVEAISVISPNPNFTKEKLLAVTSTIDGASIPAMPAQEYASSQKTQTLSNFKQVALGTIMYASDYDDELPYVQNTATIQAVTYPYMKNLDVWISRPKRRFTWMRSHGRTDPESWRLPMAT